jgi:hypothetical protein
LGLHCTDFSHVLLAQLTSVSTASLKNDRPQRLIRAWLNRCYLRDIFLAQLATMGAGSGRDRGLKDSGADFMRLSLEGGWCGLGYAAHQSNGSQQRNDPGIHGSSFQSDNGLISDS